jgi:hypothetical protein
MNPEGAKCIGIPPTAPRRMSGVHVHGLCDARPREGLPLLDVREPPLVLRAGAGAEAGDRLDRRGGGGAAQAGLSERALARELGVSASAARKLMTPGRTVLRETAARALEYVGASAHA